MEVLGGAGGGQITVAGESAAITFSALL